MTTSAVDLTRDELLSRLDVLGFYTEHVRGFKPNGAPEVKAWCPFHQGHSAALSVNRETGLFNCHGCGAAGSPVDFLMRLRGYSVADAFAELKQRVNGSAPIRKAVPVPEPREHVESIPTDLGPERPEMERYHLMLDDGTGRAIKVKYRDPVKKKTFRVFEVDPAGGFWRDLGGRKLDLYGLPPERERASKIAVLSEGEKAGKRLHAYLEERPDEAAMFVPVGSHGSSSFKNDGARLVAQLAGFREVWAIVDRDEDGAKWAEDFRRHAEARLPKIRFMQAAVETEKADLYDHLEAGLTLAELAPFAEPPRIESVTALALKPAAGALAEVVETFRRWQYLPDVRGLYAVLGAYAANGGDGDPVWFLVVGPSGSGKTETIQTLSGLPDVHAASTLTAASLLSGTPKKEKSKEAKGGLLREIGDFGILLLKDFTSILALNRDARAEVLAALREIYDGSYVRHVGTDGGRSLAWSGRVGLVGGCTPTIDRHHAVMATMGERFLLFRMPEVDRHELTRRALGHTRGASKMRAELADTVSGLFAGLDLNAEPPALLGAETEYLIGLADFVTTARSPVERDGYQREIELIPGAEAPTRLAITLARLLGGLRTIGVCEADAWSTVRKTGLDCIPANRLAVLKAIANGTDWTTKEVAEFVGYPTGTARRILEDLTAYSLVGRASKGAGGADIWRKEHAFDLSGGPDGGVPEMSAGGKS